MMMARSERWLEICAHVLLQTIQEDIRHEMYGEVCVGLLSSLSPLPRGRSLTRDENMDLPSVKGEVKVTSIFDNALD